MSGELNTARALLRAENFDGARRIVRKALEESPEDLHAWSLRIDIEMEAGEYKEALVIVRQVLAKHPDYISVRESEFFAVARLRKKGEARRLFEKFREDFPQQTVRLETMGMVLDSLSEKTKQLSNKLAKYSAASTNPRSTRDHGITHHRINDLWTAQRLMLEAHPHFPNDAELNATLATNYFQLVRPAAARRYAGLALAANPADRRMAFLKKVSWLIYFPPFFILSVILMVFFSMDRLFGRIPAYVLSFVPYYFLLDFNRIWYSLLIVIAGAEVKFLSTLFTILWIGLFSLAIHPGLYAKVFRPRKSVSLKKY